VPCCPTVGWATVGLVEFRRTFAGIKSRTWYFDTGSQVRADTARANSTAGEFMHPGCGIRKRRRSGSIINAIDQVIEQLEPRRLLTVAQDPSGWTVVTRTSGNTIYVDNGSDGGVARGSDSYDGTSPTFIGNGHGPVKTLSKARTLISDGHD